MQSIGGNSPQFAGWTRSNKADANRIANKLGVSVTKMRDAAKKWSDKKTQIDKDNAGAMYTKTPKSDFYKRADAHPSATSVKSALDKV